MSTYTYISGILCGLFLLSGFFSLFFYFRKIERELNLSYFFLAVFMSAMLTHGLISGYINDIALAVLHEKLLTTFFILAGIAFLIMISYMTGYRSVLLLSSLVIGLLVLLVMNWILPYGVTWAKVDGIGYSSILWQEQQFHLVGRTGVWNLFTILLISGIMWYAVLAIVHQIRHGDKNFAWRLLVVVCIALFGVLLDTILLEFQLRAIGLVDDIGFFGLVILVAFRNFHNLILTNEKIRENDGRLARLTEAAFEGIAFTEDGKIIDVNSQLAAMLGYGVEEMIGTNVVDYVDSGSVSLVVGKEQQAEESMYEHMARHKDGHAFPVEVNARKIVLKDRALRVSAIRDISERKKSEVENTLLATTIKSVKDCISITDLNNNLIFVNDSFLQMYGYTEDEVIGKSVSMFRSTSETNVSAEDILLALHESGDWYGELLNKRKDGSEFQIELWASPVMDDTGTTVAYVGVARDITERKRNEQALVAEKERAERSDKLKDAFIANISHEVRTPLNIIVGYTGLISELMVSKATDEEMQYFESVQRGAHRLMRTVDMMLSISRLEVGDVVLSRIPLNLSETIRQLVDDFYSVARAKDLSLSFVTEIPNALIFADEYCLMQSIHNVLDNAVKYTHTGTISVRVFQGGPDELCVSIRDTGIGVAPEYLESVFQPYTQEESGYSRRYDGIGLGLSLVKRYTELNRASVQLESTKGEGTTVTFIFPAYSDSGAVEVLPASPIGTREPLQPARENETEPRPSLLLVEDDSLTIEFMRTILGRMFTLHLAQSAAEAMDVLRQNAIDIILMDISLNGEKNGLELTSELKASQEWAHIPIIAATAHAFPEDRQHSLNAGCDEYISKPIQQELLVEIINRLHARRRSQA